MLHVCCTRSTTLSVSSALKVNPAGIYFGSWNTNSYTDEIGASAFMPCKCVHALQMRSCPANAFMPCKCVHALQMRSCPANAIMPCKSVHALRKRKLRHDITQCIVGASLAKTRATPALTLIPSPISSYPLKLEAAMSAIGLERCKLGNTREKTPKFSDLARSLVFTAG